MTVAIDARSLLRTFLVAITPIAAGCSSTDEVYVYKPENRQQIVDLHSFIDAYYADPFREGVVRTETGDVVFYGRNCRTIQRVAESPFSAWSSPVKVSAIVADVKSSDIFDGSHLAYFYTFYEDGGSPIDGGILFLEHIPEIPEGANVEARLLTKRPVLVTPLGVKDVGLRSDVIAGR